MSNTKISIDVIIPCHNAFGTLRRAVESVLGQDDLGEIYLIDDGSTDQTRELINTLKVQFPTKIHTLKFAKSRGVAAARNMGAVIAKSDFIAFLDADNAYQPQTLQACAMAFANFDVGLLRLPMKPIDMPDRFLNHKNFDTAWRTFEMTTGGNMVFYRPYFLALGGFDEHELFKKFGGEDGALGLAGINTSMIGTLFDNADFKVGVDYYCHKNMQARHLLSAMLFNENARNITEKEIQQANQSTWNAVQRMQKLQRIIGGETGQSPIILS